METSLKAHSEALFIFLFIFSLFLIGRYLESRKSYLFVLSSISIGLTASTKLNGIILYPVFLICLYMFEVLKKTRNSIIKLIKKIILSGVLIIATFVVLNPYTHKNPIVKIIEMYSYRLDLLQKQQQFSDIALFAVTDRIAVIYNTLFVYTSYSNSTLIGVFLFCFSVLGFIINLQSAVKKDVLAIVVFVTSTVSFLLVIFLLKIDWPRYYVTLMIFEVYDFVLGVQHVLKSTEKIYTIKS